MFNLEQVPLSKVLDDTPKLREKKAVTILADIVQALEDLEWKGVIHRDIKPSNIIVTSSGPSKLIGFGLSTVLEMGKTSVNDGMLVGTLDYMSPEVMNREPYDFQADIWALGAVFYESLAGLPPFASLEAERSLQIERTQDNIRRGQPAFNVPGTTFSVAVDHQDEAKFAIMAMLNKKQKERISLTELKELEIFKKYKIEFEKHQLTPRQSIHQDSITLGHHSKPLLQTSTPRSSDLIHQEMQAIEKDRHRKKTLHLTFKNSMNSITLVDGDSVRKIPSSSFMIQKTQSSNQGTKRPGELISPGIHSEATPKTSSFFLLRSLDSFPSEHVKTFAHASTLTDPVRVVEAN